MKKIISLALCLLLVISLATPAFAADSVGNGYRVKKIYYNDKEYDATIRTHYSSTQGARVSVECKAYITVLIQPLTVKYDTHNYGYITDTGSSMANGFGDNKLIIYSSYVPCSKGMAQVINYLTISGSAIFLGNERYTLNVYAWT